jgi:hypothetical protein
MHQDFEYCGFKIRINWNTRGNHRWFGGAIFQKIGTYDSPFSATFLQPSSSVDECINITTVRAKRLIDQYIADEKKV